MKKQDTIKVTYSMSSAIIKLLRAYLNKYGGHYGTIWLSQSRFVAEAIIEKIKTDKLRFEKTTKELKDG